MWFLLWGESASIDHASDIAIVHRGLSSAALASDAPVRAAPTSDPKIESVGRAGLHRTGGAQCLCH